MSEKRPLFNSGDPRVSEFMAAAIRDGASKLCMVAGGVLEGEERDAVLSQIMAPVHLLFTALGYECPKGFEDSTEALINTVEDFTEEFKNSREYRLAEDK